jgi:hypothetical protein
LNQDNAGNEFQRLTVREQFYHTSDMIALHSIAFSNGRDQSPAQEISRSARAKTADQDRTVFLTLSNIFDILNFWLAVGTGYDMLLFGDVTSKAIRCSAPTSRPCRM